MRSRSGAERARALVAGTVLLAAVLAGARPAAAYCRLTTSTSFRPSPTEPCDFSGAPLLWKRPCLGYALQVDGSDDLPIETIELAFQSSFARWSSVTCPDGPMPLSFTYLGRATCEVAEYRRHGPNVPVVVFREDSWPDDYDPNAFALTSVWHNTRTGEILDADMEFNGARFHFGVLSENLCGPSSLTADLENVATHEAGHFLGLAHSPDSGATMYGMACAGEIDKRTLEPDDIEGICTIYPGGVDRGACDPLPDNGLDLACGPYDDGEGCGAVAGKPTTAPDRGWLAALVALALVAVRRRGRRRSRRP